MITLLTPTADQPTGFALCERYMRRQTLQGQVPIHWIVVDDGDFAVTPALGQTYIRRPRQGCSGAQSLCYNLLEGLKAVPPETESLFIIEHDDWYAPTHLQETRALLQHGGAAGSAKQRYYNLPRMQWRVYPNRGACLCQTALRAELIPHLLTSIHHCLRRDSYGIDAHFWNELERHEWSLGDLRTVVGMKGLPGRAGLGVGHRPGGGWKDDPEALKLREWIGDDVDQYLAMGLRQ